MFVSVDEAVKKLNQGDVVAIPTETVYGLAAIISNPESIRSIFETKKRPFFDPLIVHVYDKTQAQKLASEWTFIHEILADDFWPGPLTMVVPKNNLVSDMITSGLLTVGLRCPNHPVALEILKKLNHPFAAPSANLFGKTSPTNALHVENEFDGKVAVVDGGPSQFGIESTIISISVSNSLPNSVSNSLSNLKLNSNFDSNLTSISNSKREVDPKKLPVVVKINFLRLGSITQNDIRLAIEKSSLSQLNYELVFEDGRKNKKILAPGQVEHHYMPTIPILWIAESTLKDDLKNRNVSEEKWMEFIEHNKEIDAIKDILKTYTKMEIQNYSLLVQSSSPVISARELYSKMRECAQNNSQIILCVKKNNQTGELWESIHDRLFRASTYKINV